LRVCRVVPDVLAIGREFDYVVPDALADRIEVGTVVRVPLHGRRVRGWVVALDVEPGTETLLPVARVSSVGPDAAVVELCRWASHRFAGPLATFLRAATPPASVAARPPLRRAGVRSGGEGGDPRDEHAPALAAAATSATRAVIRWPPLRDRRPLVDALLPARGSAIVLAADGPRAGALVRWWSARGVRAVLDRADLPGAARAEAWRAASEGGCVVVGGRVGAFAPVPDLALGVVVDDGDEALQEERAPTWHAREVLAQRCAARGAPFVVVGAAPSLEALHRADRVLALPRAAERAGWPPVEVVDRRAEAPGAGLLGERVSTALHAELDAGRFVVCVVNRRGRVRLAACAACGRVARLDDEGGPLGDPGAGGCQEPAGGVAVCPDCGATRFRQVRAGVRRLREELAALLPRAVVADVDRDTGSLEEAGGVDVVVGTEAVLHRSDVRRRRPGLVAFLDFDQELLAPRVRAAEQALRLLVRGARLLEGRPPGERRLLVQGRHVDHEVVRAARDGDPAWLSDTELARRRALDLPPFTAVAELRGDPEAVGQALGVLHDPTWQGPGVSVLGPRREGDTDVALVRAADPDLLADALAAVRARRGEGRLRIAVDPPRL
jgi:primosomal protein N' (replication factor Y)